MAWQILALAAVSMFTTLNLIQRVLAVESKNERATAVAFNLAAGLIATIFFLVTQSYKDFTLPTDYRAYIAMLSAVFFYAMFERGRFHAARLLEASVLTTVMNVSAVIAFIGSIFLYSEEVTSNKLLGSLFILCALLIVSWNRTPTRASKKGIINALIVGTMLGLGWMLDKLGAQYFNPQTYSIIVWTFPIILIYLPHVSFADIKTEFVTASWRLWLIALLNVVAYFLMLKSLDIADATSVIPLMQTSTLFTILLGIIILKERDRIFTKILAGILAICGVYLLV